MDLSRIDLLEIIFALDDNSDLRKRLQVELDRQIDWSLKEEKKQREIDRMNAAGICIFDGGWAGGRCSRHSWKGADVQMCKPHFETKCRMCGEQAYSSCSDFSGSFVCGMDVCKKHERHGSDGSHRTYDEKYPLARRR